MKRIETRKEMIYGYSQGGHRFTLLSMAVDQRWWNTFIQTYPFVYHQNMSARIDEEGIKTIQSILQNGLIPWDVLGKSVYDRTVGEPRANHVYLRTDSKTFCQFKIDARQLDPSKVDFDEDALDTNMEIEGIDSLPEHFRLHPKNLINIHHKLEPGQQSLGEYAESQSHIIDQPKFVQESIFNLKTFSYKGPISPEAISLNESYFQYDKLASLLR